MNLNFTFFVRKWIKYEECTFLILMSFYRAKGRSNQGLRLFFNKKSSTACEIMGCVLEVVFSAPYHEECSQWEKINREQSNVPKGRFSNIA